MLVALNRAGLLLPEAGQRVCPPQQLHAGQVQNVTIELRSRTDTQGTLLDGSGRFRVLLHISAVGANGNIRNTWLYQPVVVADAPHPALAPLAGQLSILYRYAEAGGKT